jgi:CheY-like chemotaxis protein
VGDGKAALERLQTESVDVVVTDLRMPRMDGAELYRRIKHRHPDLEPRVLLLSGDPSQLGELMETAVAERVVPKPVAMVELVKRIADLASARSVA